MSQLSSTEANAIIAALFEDYQKPIGRSLYYMVHRNWHAAEELCQETFLKAFKALQIPGAKVPMVPLTDRYWKNWLYEIARNTALDYLKHQKYVEAYAVPDVLPC